MKCLVRLSSVVFVLMFLMLYAPSVQAQGGMTREQKLAVSDAQFRGALNQATRQRDLAAGDQDATLYSDGRAVNLSGDQKKKVKTVYRLKDEDGVYYGADLPERSFNNIDYPY